MEPVLNEAQEKNKKCQKLLCSMYNHMACVNCVRWSLSGKYLASGADDRLVMIWDFGGIVSKDGADSENWKCTHRLQAHESDVIDLAWNRNDKFLASCSLDNSIIVWNASQKFEKVTVLKGHTNFVKGVTWDPVGSYLASQSTDNTVRIWNTVDWTPEKTIVGPFSAVDPHVLRIGWSPDGTYLIAGGAINNGGPTAQVISRKWQLGFDLVGHKKSVACVRFAPTCRYKPKTKEEEKSVLASETKDNATPCCALGSRDRSISIWLTSLKRPLVVIHDMFEDSILDLSWDSKGQILMATSWDGTIAVVEFREDEIGEQMTFKDMTLMLEKHYGSSVHDISDIVIENPAMMHFKDKQKQTTTAEIIPAGPKNQIIGKRKDGKKRITPAFIGGLPSSTPKPFGTKETTFKFPDNIDEDKEAMEVDESGKIIEKGYPSLIELVY